MSSEFSNGTYIKCDRDYSTPVSNKKTQKEKTLRLEEWRELREYGERAKLEVKRRKPTAFE